MKNLFKRKKVSAFYKGEDVKDIFTQKFDGEAKVAPFVTDNPIAFQPIPESLSKRDYFAGLAMQGIISGGFIHTVIKATENPEKFVAQYSVMISDLIIKELENTEDEKELRYWDRWGKENNKKQL